MNHIKCRPGVELLECRSLPNSIFELMLQPVLSPAYLQLDLPTDHKLDMRLHFSPSGSNEVDQVAPSDLTSHQSDSFQRPSPGEQVAPSDLTSHQSDSFQRPGPGESEGRSWADGAYLVGEYNGNSYDYKGYTYSGLHDEIDIYAVGLTGWLVKATPASPSGTGQCMSNNFVTVVSDAFPDWTLTCSANSLSDGSLHVRTYDTFVSYPVVGVDFQVDYAWDDQSGDPNPENMHWIQVVQDNHAINGNHGDAENLVDLCPNATTPYYDDDCTADGESFGDQPRMPDAGASHTWDAELYFVEEVGGNTVKAWAGISWGFVNHRRM